MQTIGVALVTVALTVCGTLKSDAQIRGEAVDPAGVTVSRTTIRVLDAETRKTVQTLRTGADGRFEFRDLAPARYAITLSSSGFSPVLVDVDTTKPGTDVFRTIRMQIRDCDAPGEFCDCFSQCPVSEPHPVVVKAPLKIGLEDAIDLDKGMIVPLGSPAASLSLLEKEGGLFVSSLNGAVLQNGCKPQYGRGRKNTQSAPFRVDGLAPGTEICITTKRGRFSKLFLTAEVKPGDQQVLVQVVTRNN